MKQLYRKTESLDETDIEIMIKDTTKTGVTRRTGYGEEVKLPTDVESFDAVKALQKDISDLGQDPEIVDINSWMMGVNWAKDFLTEDIKCKN